MGGLSRGSKKLTKNSLLFKGNVSLDNNGGFSSLRRSFSEFDISNFEYVEIKYRSSGISLALTFAVSRRWYVPNYKVSLDGTSSKWKTITLKLTDLRKYYIGKAMNEKLKKETLDSKLAEIDKASSVVALEAKIAHVDEIIEKKKLSLYIG